jgi:hypothetical protein
VYLVDDVEKDVTAFRAATDSPRVTARCEQRTAGCALRLPSPIEICSIQD